MEQIHQRSQKFLTHGRICRGPRNEFLDPLRLQMLVAMSFVVGPGRAGGFVVGMASVSQSMPQGLECSWKGLKEDCCTWVRTGVFLAGS